MKYWCVGHKWGNTSQLERFLQESVWEGWFDDIQDKSQINDAQKITQGDILILKSSFTKGSKHDIPCLRISALAVVINQNVEYSNGKTKFNCKVKYFCTKPKDFEGSSFGKYRKTIQECNNVEIIYYININRNNMKKQELKELLESTHNLILTGAPGTGKTFLAKEIAKEMGCTDNEIGFVQFHPSYDYTDFVEGLRPIQDDNGNVGFERKDGVFKAFCAKALEKIDTSNFDSAYDTMLEELSDEQLKLQTPTNKQFAISVNSKGNLTLYTGNELKQNGVLTKARIKAEFCGLPTDKWWKGYYKGVVDYLVEKYKLKQQILISNRPFVFIIDEINRGDFSKIFGELFYSIDPGYRIDVSKISSDNKPITIKTQYANMVSEPNEFDLALGETQDFGHFFVPENVYIIGTMNDIDRSVESMDFAFRRRFAFKEIKADKNVGMLDTLAQKDEAIKRMQSLNAAIEKVDGLSSAYHIGANYFLKLKDYNGDFDKLWKYHLEGLLREYLRGMTDVDAKIEALHKAYDNEADSDSGQQQ